MAVLGVVVEWPLFPRWLSWIAEDAAVEATKTPTKTVVTEMRTQTKRTDVVDVVVEWPPFLRWLSWIAGGAAVEVTRTSTKTASVTEMRAPI
jgi:acyl-CoA hydrolase